MAAARSRYSTVAIAFHWTIAALILANIAIGWRMGRLKGLAQFDAFQLHKSIGITVLLLSVLRLGWRLAHPAPPLPAAMPRRERQLATAAHALLYTLMIVLPLTGWIVVSASLYNLPTLLFRTVPWPHLAPVHALPTADRAAIEAQVGTLHAWLAWSMAALIGLHVAAALKHHWWNRDDVLTRMLPSLRRTSPSPAPSEN